ncbi:MAG: hypothetical protein ABSF15_25275, partial [Candidatus Sulfotelmatobacter sp.]
SRLSCAISSAIFSSATCQINRHCRSCDYILYSPYQSAKQLPVAFAGYYVMSVTAVRAQLLR